MYEDGLGVTEDRTAAYAWLLVGGRCGARDDDQLPVMNCMSVTWRFTPTCPARNNRKLNDPSRFYVQPSMVLEMTTAAHERAPKAETLAGSHAGTSRRDDRRMTGEELTPDEFEELQTGVP